MSTSLLCGFFLSCVCILKLHPFDFIQSSVPDESKNDTLGWLWLQVACRGRRACKATKLPAEDLNKFKVACEKIRET